LTIGQIKNIMGVHSGALDFMGKKFYGGSRGHNNETVWEIVDYRFIKTKDRGSYLKWAVLCDIFNHTTNNSIMDRYIGIEYLCHKIAEYEKDINNVKSK